MKHAPNDVQAENMVLRHEIHPGDLGWIVQRHGEIYARDYGFDHTFEAFVALPLAETIMQLERRERLWIAEADGRRAGCVAIIKNYPKTAQLRWFFVDPEHRGHGLGRRLLNEALSFARAQKYDILELWTVRVLTTAAKLYVDAGFRRVQEHRHQRWGTEVVEEKYQLRLADAPAGSTGTASR